VSLAAKFDDIVARADELRDQLSSPAGITATSPVAVFGWAMSIAIRSMPAAQPTAGVCGPPISATKPS
jgi:hypothetical protein